MKFAKVLEQDLVPEWHAKYFDYKQGKKRVKAVARAMGRMNATPKSTRLDPRDSYRTPGSPLLGRKPQPSASQNQNRRPQISDNTLVGSEGQDPDPHQPSDDNEALRRPILIKKKSRDGSSKLPDHLMPSYGSFVPTPRSEFMSEQLELPDPALTAGERAQSPGLEKRQRNTMPKRSRFRDVDGAAPTGAANTLEATTNSGAYTIGEVRHPHRTAIGSVFHRGSPMIRHASTANIANQSNLQPLPLLRRIFTAGTMEEEPDVSMIPLDVVKTRERDFFKWMDTELEKVESFYKLKEEEAGERLQVLRDQLHEMRNRRIDEIAKVKRNHVRNHDEQPSILHEMSTQPTRAPSLTSLHGLGLGRPGSKDESAGLNGWTKPVEKALEALKPKPRPGANSNHLAHMPKSPHIPSQEQTAEGMPSTHRGYDPARDYVRKGPGDVPYRSAKRKLKLALKEYYRGLELLKSYALLNRTAFRKMNKKYDKAANSHPSLRYMSDKVNKAWFVQSDVVDGYLHAVEDLYGRYFERGNHKVAMGKLRSSTRSTGTFTGSAFRSGLLIGTGAVFGIQGLINARSLTTNHPNSELRVQASYLLQIYGGYLLGLYLFAFFCLDCAIWAQNKINYVFIFEFDPRSHLDWRKMSEFPAFFTLLLGLFVWINFSGLGTEAMFLYYPVVLIFVTILVILWPAPGLFHHSRQWFAYSHWRLLLAGLYPVEFRDFFLGDMYCSLTYVTANIELFFCLYARHWDDPPMCNSSHSRLLGFFTALPGIWRALQCLRRYYDTRALFPHMANFGKYTTTILYYVFLSIYRIHESKTNLALFITAAVCNSVYCTFWDLGMDWSLLQPATTEGTSLSKTTGKSYPLLRPVLGYKSPYYYYGAMIADIILRWNWIFYAVFTHDTQHSTTASFFISFAEVTRRGIWTIFRVENEHAANVSRFKASRDVPLPYKLSSSDSNNIFGSLVQDETPKASLEAHREEDGRTDRARTEEMARLESVPTQEDAGGTGANSLRRVLTQTLSRTKSRGGTAKSTGAQAGAEDAGQPSMRRRQTLTQIFAEAHTKDFEKKRKGSDISEDEGHGGGGIDELEREASSDEEGMIGKGSEGEEDVDDIVVDEGTPGRRVNYEVAEDRRMTPDEE